MATAAAAHAKLLATPRCMNAPNMALTLAAHASVREASPKSWEVASATACTEASNNHFQNPLCGAVEMADGTTSQCH